MTDCMRPLNNRVVVKPAANCEAQLSLASGLSLGSGGVGCAQGTSAISKSLPWFEIFVMSEPIKSGPPFVSFAIGLAPKLTDLESHVVELDSAIITYSNTGMASLFSRRWKCGPRLERGDTIGCGVMFGEDRNWGAVLVTHNGQIVECMEHVSLSDEASLYPTVSVAAPGMLLNFTRREAFALGNIREKLEPMPAVSLVPVDASLPRLVRTCAQTAGGKQDLACFMCPHPFCHALFENVHALQDHVSIRHKRIK